MITRCPVIYPSILDRRVKEHMDRHMPDSMEIIISFKVGGGGGGELLLTNSGFLDLYLDT